VLEDFQMPKKNSSLTTIENKVLELINLLMGIHSGIRQHREETGMPQIPSYQLKALSAFTSQKTTTMGALTKNAFVNKSSMSEMIKRLEKAGLVQRMRNPLNQREVQVSLTAQGLALQKKITQTRTREMQQTFTELDLHDQAALVEALDTAIGLIQKALNSRKNRL
jgi:DNA-binding MarR family transcriptional regulator